MIILKYIKALFLASDYPIPNEHDKLILKRFGVTLLILVSLAFIGLIIYFIYTSYIWLSGLSSDAQLFIGIVVICFIFSLCVESENRLQKYRNK